MPFAFTRRNPESSALSRAESLAQLLGKSPAELKKEVWLFAVPHDDDVAIGGALWLKAAVEAGVEVHILAATDGRMGFCAPEEKKDIVAVRAEELIASSHILGLDPQNIHLLGFPDCSLSKYLGRRDILAGEHDAEGKTGYTGLQGAFVQKLRQIKPTRLIMPSPQDYHPDHQVVYNEMMICIFHAAGGVWPELGASCAVPEVYEMAIYCDFPSPPTLQLKCDAKSFQAKLDCIAAYKSQKQIGALVEKVRGAGPVEYLREVGFHFYDANAYHGLFDAEAADAALEEEVLGDVLDEVDAEQAIEDYIADIASEVAGQVAEQVAKHVLKAKKEEKKAKKEEKKQAKEAKKQVAAPAPAKATKPAVKKAVKKPAAKADKKVVKAKK